MDKANISSHLFIAVSAMLISQVLPRDFFVLTVLCLIVSAVFTRFWASMDELGRAP